MNLFKKCFQTKIRFYLIGIIFILFLGSLFYSTLKTDDDFIGEQVYWLNKTDHVKSELMRGYNNIGIEQYQSVFHKLFIYQGAFFSKIFGWSLQVLHLTTIFFASIFFCILWLFLKEKQNHFDTGTFLLVTCIMFCFNPFAEYLVSFRPEIMLMTLGFISYFFIDKYFNQQKIIYAILSGLFAGAAFLTHLNGLIFLIGGFLILLYRKNYKVSIVFGIAGSLVFSLYFLDILQNSTISYFLYQFRHDPSLSEENFLWKTPFIRLFEEHLRFFHSPAELVLMLPLFLSLFFVKDLRKTENNILVYTLILLVSFALLTYSKTTKYIIIYLPFLAIIIANGWQEIENKAKSMRFKWFFRISLGLLFCWGIAFSASQILIAATQPKIQITNNNIAKYIKEDHSRINVLAPTSFIFNEIKSFNRIMTLNRFSFFIDTHNIPKMNFSQLIDSAHFYQINYIILDRENANYFNVTQDMKLNDKRYSFASLKLEKTILLKMNYE